MRLGAERFHNYLFGNEFTLFTDNKPLVSLLALNCGKMLPPRIQRLAWRLHQYSYKIKHIPGEVNIADPLSRLPLEELDKTTSGKVTDEYVKFVVEFDVPDACALSLSEVKAETKKDNILSRILSLVQADSWSTEVGIKPFNAYREELSAYKGILLRRNRIVVPTSLQKRVLKLAHENHVGIVRTKKLLRSKYFWIGMDRDIEFMIKNCPACATTRSLNVNTPLQPVPLPRGPWVNGAVNIVGPIQNKYLVSYIDYYSSFPEATVTRDIGNIIRILMNMFSRHGYPEEMVSDNGPQFVSNEFTKFFSSKGIKHVRASPYYPRSNGRIERFHRYLKTNFQAVVSEGKSWERELPKILMSYRSIPHPVTGKTPANMLFQREIRTELPSVEPSCDFNEVEQNARSYQKQMKSYHDQKNHVKEHQFAVGDIVYLARNSSHGKLDARFSTIKCVIIKFQGRDTCKIVSTVDGKTYVRNVKYLTHAPIDGRALIFDDVEENVEVSAADHECVK